MQNLFTSAGETLTGMPWNTYPRPQLVRKDWLCLNGQWEFISGGTKTEIRPTRGRWNKNYHCIILYTN